MKENIQNIIKENKNLELKEYDIHIKEFLNYSKNIFEFNNNKLFADDLQELSNNKIKNVNQRSSIKEYLLNEKYILNNEGSNADVSPY
jgi:hypothetical protein